MSASCRPAQVYRRCFIAKRKTNSEEKEPTPNGQARDLAIALAKLADATHCKRVKVLDVRGISPMTDYFVIASGTSARQMRTVADESAELSEQFGYKPTHTAGYEGEAWIAIDFVDVVVHVFEEEARNYYDLEGLWGDAKPVKWD